MNAKRIFRGPILWIVLAVIAIGLLVDLTGNLTGGFSEEPTSKVVSIINGNDPIKEVVLVDGEQEIQVTMAGDKPAEVQGGLGRQPERAADRPAERAGGRRHPRVAGSGKNPTPGFFQTLLGTLIPFIIIGVLFFFLLNSVQGGGSRVMQFGKSKAKVANKDTPKTTFSRRRRLRGGDRGARGDQGVPGRAGQVPGGRGEDPQGRPAVRPARHRQDAAGPRGRRRGGRAVLLDLRLGLRGDVRRRRRQPRPGPVRAGQGERAGHRLHRRDRRRRPAPRRRHGRRPRRARADPEPAAGRDGRLRRPRRRHPDRGHQPARRARPGAAAARPLRPPDRRRGPRPERSVPDPPGARRGQADGAGRRPRGCRPPHPGFHRRRPGQRAERGRPADRPEERADDHQRCTSTRRSTGSSPDRRSAAG